MEENDSSLVPMGGYPGAPVTEGCSVLVPNRLYEAYIFDLDGTIYLGDELLPGAKRLINALRERGKAVRFVSNNPTKDPMMYAEKLARLGLPTPLGEIVNTVITMTRLAELAPRTLALMHGSSFNGDCGQALNDLARRMREELNVRTVSQKVLRGTAPDHVKVVLEVAHKRGEFDLSVPKFLYHSTEGFSAAVDGTVVLGNNRFSAGLVSDGDELAERYAGVRARYETARSAATACICASSSTAITINGTARR